MAEIFSQNLRTRIALVQETAWGDTPATPAMVLLPVTAFGLNLTRNEIKDQSIRSDRMQRYSISGNSTVGGDIGVDLANNGALKLLASALNKAPAGNVYKVGTEQISFTVEQASKDTDLYSVYTGVVASSAKISIGLNDVLKMTVSCIGQDLAIGTTPLAGATYGAESTATPYTHFSGTIKEGGAVCGLLSGVEFDIASNASANFALGDRFAKNVTPGLQEITGTATAYFKDNSLLQKFLSGTASSLEITATDEAGNDITFLAPNIKYTQATKQISSSGSVTVSLSFTALWDEAHDSPLVVTTA